MEGWQVGILECWKVGRIVILLSNLPTFQPSLTAQDTVPAGYGTLRRDDIVVQLSTGTIGIQLLPLEEQVIRLLAPDTHRSLHQLVSSPAAEIPDSPQPARHPHPT